MNNVGATPPTTGPSQKSSGRAVTECNFGFSAFSELFGAACQYYSKFRAELGESPAKKIDSF